MHIDKESVPTKVDAPGATARHKGEFGDATGYGAFAGEYLSFGAGTDLAPLLHGLEDNACQSPHWGYVLSGALEVTYTDGGDEKCTSGQLFYWPPGHSVRVHEDAEIVMFSPEAEHAAVLDHVLAKIAGG